MSVETFASDLAVERFYEGIVRRFARTREVECYIVRVGPEIEVSGYELAALVDTDRSRITDLTADPFQSPHDVFGAIVKLWIDDGGERREGIDNRQNTDLVPESELVVHEVHSQRLLANAERARHSLCLVRM